MCVCVCVSERALGRKKHFVQRDDQSSGSHRCTASNVHSSTFIIDSESMKESNRVGQEKQAWLDANRNGQTCSCLWNSMGNNAKTTGTRAQDRLDLSVPRMNRSSGGGQPPGPRQPADFQLAAKSTRSAHSFSRSRDVVVLREPRRGTAAAVAHSNLLPPIAGSTAIPRQDEDSPVVSASVPKSLTRLSNSIVMREKTSFRVLVARHKRRTEISDQSSGSVLGVSFRILNNDLNSETRSGPLTGGIDRAKSPVAAAAPALMELKIGPQKSDACPTAAVEPNTRDLKAGQQRALCWDDSDVETESQCSEGSVTWRDSHWLEETDEYYTSQRIADWVVKVNSTLFNTTKENLGSIIPAEEQDISTIKIIYDGD